MLLLFWKPAVMLLEVAIPPVTHVLDEFTFGLTAMILIRTVLSEFRIEQLGASLHPG